MKTLPAYLQNRLLLGLILSAACVLSGSAREEVAFPFSRATRITFIRLGDLKADAGQQFVLAFKGGKWIIERRISRTAATTEEIPPARAEEILLAFEKLYTHWQEQPQFDPTTSGYSMFVAINNTWLVSMSVRDDGSPSLNNLLEVIEYPSGVALSREAEAEAAATNTPLDSADSGMLPVEEQQDG